MRKSDKKLEKNIVSALTEACEDALEAYEGFQWLTHIVNYQHFPESLSIVCVFNNKEHLQKALDDNKGEQLKGTIEKKLLTFDIKVKGIKKRILFDTEEACEAENDGNWSKRFESFKSARHV
ncbi:hypothetical protein A7985_06210 [Pseudoalteromonas luteoviolacea]|uniref:Fis family transcriptional regulator n=1 Tax=Pseudoalteromonas luteoviolacea TaxID=43657 RepID=A0A1C0TW47_9GAMM|nr:hypothetical protein [Pseudoalteromonas luteoviolacea]MBQ4810054.1 Fis family transcriptional regulator [Pseudoalteromonas luteoviolacea]OCQ23531.1 hypothetical protein A7985_06210 [Pseudoalteromonas luteoviolacea]